MKHTKEPKTRQPQSTSSDINTTYREALAERKREKHALLRYRLAGNLTSTKPLSLASFFLVQFSARLQSIAQIPPAQLAVYRQRNPPRHAGRRRPGPPQHIAQHHHSYTTVLRASGKREYCSTLAARLVRAGLAVAVADACADDACALRELLDDEGGGGAAARGGDVRG